MPNMSHQQNKNVLKMLNTLIYIVGVYQQHSWQILETGT